LRTVYVGRQWCYAEVGAKVCTQPRSPLDELGPIVMKLIPYLAIELAAVRKSNDTPLTKFRIKRAEVAELARDSGWGTVQDVRQLNDCRVARFCSLEGNTAIQVKCKNELIPGPRLTIL